MKSDHLLTVYQNFQYIIWSDSQTFYALVISPTDRVYQVSGFPSRTDANKQIRAGIDLLRAIL